MNPDEEQLVGPRRSARLNPPSPVEREDSSVELEVTPRRHYMRRSPDIVNNPVSNPNPIGSERRKKTPHPSVASTASSSHLSIKKRELEHERKQKEMELDVELEEIQFKMINLEAEDGEVRTKLNTNDDMLKDENVSDEVKRKLHEDRPVLFNRINEIAFEYKKLKLLLDHRTKLVEREKQLLQEKGEIEIDKIMNLLEDIDEQRLSDEDDVPSTKSKRAQEWVNKTKPPSSTGTDDDLQDPIALEKEAKAAAEKRAEEHREKMRAFIKQQEIELAEYNKNKNEQIAAATAQLKNLQTTANEKVVVTTGSPVKTETVPPSTKADVPEGAAAISNFLPQFMARQTIRQDLPPFDGSIQEWPIFESQFKMTTEACKLSSVENLQRLQKSLKGEARECVRTLLVSPDNVPEIMKILERSYGNPKSIIQNIIQEMRNVTKIHEENYSEFLKYVNKVRNLTTAATTLKCQPYVNNVQFVDSLVKKLPGTFQLKWANHMKTKSMFFPELSEFSSWMDDQGEEIRLIFAPPGNPTKAKGDKEKKHEVKENRRRRDHALAAAPTEKDDEESKNPSKKKNEKYCHQCSMTGHRLDTCTKFMAMDPKARMDLFIKKGLCRGCGRRGHKIRDCKIKKPCGIENCTQEHHTLLHKNEEKTADDLKINNAAIEAILMEGDSAQSDEMKHADEERGEIQFHIAPVTLCGQNGKILKTYVFLDSGAGITTIDKKVADFLGLEGEKAPLHFTGLTSSTTVADSRRIDLDIITRNKEKFRLRNVRTVDQLRLPQRTLTKKNLNRWNHLRGLDIHTYKIATPTILIGQDHPDLLAPFRRIDGPPNSPIASLTKFGWVLYGRLAPTLEVPKSEPVFLTQEEDWNYLHNLIKTHYSIEDFGVKLNSEKPQGKEDKRAEMLINQTLKKVDGRYEAGLLWRAEDISLPESKDNALKRLHTMERKMDKDPVFAKKYCEKFTSYEKSGFIRKLTQTEINQTGPRMWYLPHFGVTKPTKPDKIRLVFDAAAKSHGCSLNDHLLKGPDNLTPLIGVLFKFREKAVGICADIKEMYHQVRMKAEDQHSQRFLWRGMERNTDPDEYVLPVMFFGAACSPSLAQEAKNRNAMDYADRFPDVAHAIIEKNYVDDFLASKDTAEESYQLFKDVFYINHKGGFYICNWISSSMDVMKQIPEELRAGSVKTIDLDSDESLIERVLGLHWKPLDDIFTFRTQFARVRKSILEGVEMPTKLEALSLLMSIFDPLGFLGNFTVKAKIMLQDTWRKGIGWDDEIPSSMQEGWSSWIKELQKIEEFRIPRCYSKLYSKSDNIELHIFCDASESAYATVAYFRITSSKEEIEVSLISSKTRVAPLKPLSIPRMELQAAVMGVRLAQTIKEKHEVKPHRTVYWTDSKTVLCWLRSDGRRFQQFVSHRIGEIQEISDVSEWKWVPTTLNVADDATRNIANADLTPASRWVNGPTFLYFDEEHWPTEKRNETEILTNDLELKKEVVNKLEYQEPVIQLHNFSSWTRLIRVTAWVFKIISYHFNRTKIPALQPADLEKSTIYWLRKSQTESFKEELMDIASEKGIKKQSRLYKIPTFLDSDGLLKVKGRLQGADCIIRAAKFPIILDPKHRVTRLLITFYHEAAKHHGQERVANEIRQRFHILNLRTAVRSSWFHCQQCRNNRAEPPIPKMGQLPPSRLQRHVVPFTITGMDYFGPMEVTVGRSHQKRYGVLFTCMSTRAVHIEIAHSLSTDSCIMAIRRFAARRGNPKEIHSDNGTNFKGANNELQAALKDLDVSIIQSNLVNRGIKWIFIPPAAPHMGGSWERLVKSIKVALHATLKERYPKDETLLTLMTEAEHVVNSRPLTHVPMDPEDEEALTPNHFLIGTTSNLQPPGHFDEKDLCLRKQWRIAQRLADHFWERWIREFLPSLILQSKWHEPREPVKEGDVGIIVDERMPRNTWPKGIIKKIYPGKDGLVRVVDIETKTGTYRRPVAKIAILDVRKPGDAELAGNCIRERTTPAPDTPFRKNIREMKRLGSWQKIMQDYKQWLSTKEAAA